MTEHPERGPSAAERLQVEYPDVVIHRELLEGGGHGDWVAEMCVTVRSRDVETLRVLLERARGLGTVGHPWASQDADERALRQGEHEGRRVA